MRVLVSNAGFRRYLKTIGGERFAIDPDKIEEERKFDGVFVLRTNTQSQSARGHALLVGEARANLAESVHAFAFQLPNEAALPAIAGHAEQFAHRPSHSRRVS